MGGLGRVVYVESVLCISEPDNWAGRKETT